MGKQATKRDKLNADLINDTLLNTSTHFLYKKREKGHLDHKALSYIFL